MSVQKLLQNDDAANCCSSKVDHEGITKLTAKCTQNSKVSGVSDHFLLCDYKIDFVAASRYFHYP